MGTVWTYWAVSWLIRWMNRLSRLDENEIRQHFEIYDRLYVNCVDVVIPIQTTMMLLMSKCETIKINLKYYSFFLSKVFVGNWSDGTDRTGRSDLCVESRHPEIEIDTMGDKQIHIFSVWIGYRRSIRSNCSNYARRGDLYKSK